MRIIDAQQILMQEPRASWKGAQLIAHADFQNEIIRQRRIQEQRRKAAMVTKLSGVFNQSKVKGRAASKNAGNTKFSQGKKNTHIDVRA